VAVHAIGDVQGCSASLERLLRKLSFDATADTLWFVGDLVNRGPDSLGVLRFVHGLGVRAALVLGNHDLHLLAVHHGCATPRRADTFGAILDAPDREELMEWLATRPLLHHDEGLGFAMAHAGIPAIWSIAEAAARAAEVEAVLRGPDRARFLRAMYGNAPAAWSENLAGEARWRVITNYLTRMRTLRDRCTLDLEFKEDATALPPGSRPWFEDYRGRDAAARPQFVFGHWAALQGGCDVPGIHALDTGCVWGGRLSALRLVDAKRFSVACRDRR
jgi:bis(5'-nucleosyl)-tetraphosphatase (symmetrical)